MTQSANQAINLEFNPLNNYVQERTNNLCLPKIDLPSFSGSFEKWYSFYDISFVDIQPVTFRNTKFHYFKAALKEEVQK